MKWLPRRWWHRIHLLSFVVFATSTVHAFQAGTDVVNPLVQWLALTGITLVLFLVLFRLLASRSVRAVATRSKGPSALVSSEAAA
jgi:DMSO/TMAO reductase YedYZ heme-binding membrane subunit